MPKLNKHEARSQIVLSSLLVLVACGHSTSPESSPEQEYSAHQAAESVEKEPSTTSVAPTDGVGASPGFGAALPVEQPEPANPSQSITLPANAETITDSQEAPAPAAGTQASMENLNTTAELNTDALPSMPSAELSATFCEGQISSADSFVVPALQKPDFLQQYRDPVFGSLVTRITNGAFGEVNKPAYSTMQAWNADESLMLLYRTGVKGAGHKLHDGHTYEFIQDLDIYPSDLEQVFWSRTDPAIFFYVSKQSGDFGKLKRYNVSLGQSVELANFSAQCGAGLPHAGNDVQMHAINDDLFGFTCQQDDGQHIMFSYKPSTGEVVMAPVGTGTRWELGSAPSVAASGERFWHQGAVLDTDLATVNFQLDLGSTVEHSSMGETHKGEDAYYQVSFNSSPNGCDGDPDSGVGHLVEHNLETGGCRNIISQSQGYPYTTSSTHVSALSIDRPERVAMSSIGRKSQLPLFENGAEAPALFSEIYLAQTTPDDTVICRLAHHRSYGKSATKGGYAPYFGEPHATISPSGTRILFGSDWYNSGTVDSYVVELPDYIKP